MRIATIIASLILLAGCPSAANDDDDVTAAGDDDDSTPQTGDDVVEEIPDFASMFSHPHGWVDQSFELTLTNPLGEGEVRYTFDGWDPLRGDPEVYSGPILIQTTTVVRAAVWVDGEPFWDGGARTWIFADDVPNQQRPEGWPTDWWEGLNGGPYPADYEVDPEVVGADLDGTLFPGLFFEVPAVALVIDPDDLFGEDGIHENSIEGGSAWERDAYSSFLGFGAETTEPVYSGVRIHGGAGRRADRTPKKSFRLTFRGEYSGDLRLPVYETGDVERFDTLLLRAGYNRTWGYYSHGGRRRAQYVREPWTGASHAAMGWTAVRVRPVHMFLNGLYWGVYQAQERPDASFQAERLGGNADEYDAINSGVVSDGDLDAWNDLIARAREDLTDPSAYASLQEVLDLTEFADYMLLNHYAGNVDWPIKNWWAGRKREDGETWRFFIWDAELIQTAVEENVLGNLDEGTPGEIFGNLSLNPDFRTLYGDRTFLHLYGDGALGIEENVARWEGMSERVVPAIIGESARWGDHWRDVRGDPEAELYTYEDHWLEEADRIVNDWFPERTEIFVGQLVAQGLYPALPPPEVQAVAGATGTPRVRIDAVAGEAWCALAGTDPRAPGGAVAAEAFACTGIAEAPLTARALLDGVWSPRVDVKGVVGL
ncbi:MAG: CotH kinase family protein [Deltaproteobacteria bacterium]|nr:CotH kinase family protein [Deltaproteobacteria bacterium]